ncbi:nucleoside phosphorylase domain-containing protein [Plectosphaerella plurivora]|uniref:Nucleoside phosphorylase domain-containing protein n=1 Tax=Plectosphaerella plurivora TaxID=936078 RepID=A0A9P9ABK5_9PEZI|nr:nucleoside phosphorylase domain-containing protein [Plectosphaerella plurivora]
MSDIMYTNYSDYTMAVICATSSTMSAVRYMLDKEHGQGPPRQSGDTNTYILGQMRGHNVVLVCLPSQQGKAAAAMVATNLARTFRSIRLRLYVGVGGGVPSQQNDVRLGDVVVSMPTGPYGGVVQYDLGKKIEGDDPSGSFVLKGILRPPPDTLVGAVEVMRSDHLARDSKIDEFVDELMVRRQKLDQYKRPSNDLDVLFQADHSHVKSSRPGIAGLPCEGNCDRRKIVQRPGRYDPSESVIHYGLIASGDSFIRSATYRDNIASRFGGDVLCFETGAAGLMTGYECLVICGVSDYCDSHESDIWHNYAAAAAAACAKEVIERLGPDAEDRGAAAPNNWKSQNMSSWARNQNLPGSEPVFPQLMLQDSEEAGALNSHQIQSNVLSGRRIQNTGSGNFSVGSKANAGWQQGR